MDDRPRHLGPIGHGHPCRVRKRSYEASAVSNRDIITANLTDAQVNAYYTGVSVYRARLSKPN
jgi:hypothetical protein